MYYVHLIFITDTVLHIENKEQVQIVNIACLPFHMTSIRNASIKMQISCGAIGEPDDVIPTSWGDVTCSLVVILTIPTILNPFTSMAQKKLYRIWNI